MIAPGLAAFIADVTHRYPVSEVLLFGSRARGDARSDSDWDASLIPAEAVTW